MYTHFRYYRSFDICRKSYILCVFSQRVVKMCPSGTLLNSPLEQIDCCMLTSRLFQQSHHKNITTS
jgi:hypothetical protein